MPASDRPVRRVLLRRYGGAPGWLLLAVVIVVAVVAIAVVARPSPVQSTPRPDHPLAVFIGDSYAQGTGASSPAKRWTTVLSQEAGWSEQNLGRGGTGYVTTADVNGCGLTYCPNYQQMVQRAIDLDPDIVVVSGGQNDFGAWQQDSSRVVAAIDQVYRGLRRALPRVTIYAVGPSTTGGVSGPVVGMDAAVRAAAAREDAHYVSLIDPNVIEPSMVVADGGHVDDAGHQAIARRVLQAVREVQR